VLSAIAVGCVPAAHLLATAHWPRRSPAVAIALWQALGLSWGLATVGALVGLGATGLGGSLAVGQAAGRAGDGSAGQLAGWRLSGVAAAAVNEGALLVFGSDRPGLRSWTVVTGLRAMALTAGVVLLAVLCWILIAAITTVLRARHRQRALLGLLAHGDPKVPGALVVDHPAAAAYCVPGLRSAIVISAGTLDLLDQAELAAVLAHERAHLRARHDLVLLPFVALLRAFRWSGTARDANRQVALLVEMMADDRAMRHRPARELAMALLRVGAAGGGQAPAGALAAAAAADGELAARVTRLLRPPPGLSVISVALLCSAAALLVIAPVAALLLPL
jgi:Zn-dependent protease with chaperone function